MLSVLPLPHWLDVARPDLLVDRGALLVDHGAARGRIDARISSPACALDAFKGVVLGQHALALCLATYIAIKLHLRIRIFPIWHQALTVFWLLALYQFVLFWIDGVTGHPITNYARWMPAFTGAAALAGVRGAAGECVSAHLSRGQN